MAMFSHGRLRLYLLKLLNDEPRHGYDLMRLLESQFGGSYSPSAGTIYPRLQRMEADGLVRHTISGGRKVYEITDAGRAELAARADELLELDASLTAAMAEIAALPAKLERDLRGAVRDAAGAAVRVFGAFGYPRGVPSPSPSVTPSTPAPAGGVEELERRASLLLEEVRRLTASTKASAETVRATLVVLDATIDQVRRLLR